MVRPVVTNAVRPIETADTELVNSHLELARPVCGAAGPTDTSSEMGREPRCLAPRAIRHSVRTRRSTRCLMQGRAGGAGRVMPWQPKGAPGPLATVRIAHGQTLRASSMLGNPTTLACSP